MIRKELRSSHDSASGGFRRFFFGDAGTRPLMEEFLVFIRREWRIFSSVITTCFFFPNKRFQHFKQKYPQLVFFSKEFSSISWVTFRGFFFGMVLGPRQWSVFESFCFLEKNDGEDLRTITTAATIMYIIHCIHIYIYIIYIATHIHTLICNNNNNDNNNNNNNNNNNSNFHQFPFLWTFFLPPPQKTNQRIPGEDVMRVQQTETFEARLASPLLPFYATWQAVDSDRISTEKRKVVVMPKKRWGYYYRTPCQNGLVDKWVTGVLTPGM